MKLLPTASLFLFLNVSAFVSNGQDICQPGSRSLALAGSSASLAGCWSVFGNQAGLAGITRIEIGGAFFNRFLVSELSTRAGLVVVPVQSSVFAISLYQFGKTPFRQEKYGLTYSRRISPHLNFGLQFNYYRLFLSEDNRFVGSSGLELGFQYSFPDLVLGLHVRNPYKTGFDTHLGTYRYCSKVNLGAFYQLSDSFGLMVEIENDFSPQIIVRTGIEYGILDKFYLRAGVSGRPYQFSAGIGFHQKNLTVDLASSYHTYLGNSPSVSFQYQFR